MFLFTCTSFFRSKQDPKSADELMNESTDSGNQTDLRGSSIVCPIPEVPPIEDFRSLCDKGKKIENNIHTVIKENSEHKNDENNQDAMKLNNSFYQDVSVVATSKVNDNLTEQSEDNINVTLEFIGPSIITNEADSEISVEVKSKLNLDDKLANIENIPPIQQWEDCSNCNVNDTELKLGLYDVCQQTEDIYLSKAIKPTRVNLNQENVLQEIENKEESVIPEVSSNDQIIINDSNDSSNEQLVVILNNDKSKFSSSSNNQHIPFNKDYLVSLGHSQSLKNKENEDTHSGFQNYVKTKVPITKLKGLSSKPPILKPATLQQCTSMNNTKWVNDLKQKKIPQPKKPYYMVIQANFNLLRNYGKTEAQINKTPLVKTENFVKPKINHLVSKSKFQTPKFSPAKKQFEYVKSPISEYIRTDGATPGKSLSVMQTTNVS